MNRSQLLFVAFGDPSVKLQALYAALSAHAWGESNSQQINIFTDTPSDFNDFQDFIEFHPLTSVMLREWLGPARYPYRLKIAAMRSMASAYPADDLLFLDADTFFTGPVIDVTSRITKVQSVMHRKEYAIATHPSGQLQRFRRHMRRYGGKTLGLDIDMWNSGVIGLHATQTVALDEVLRGIDLISPHFRKGLVEQYFVSKVLQERTTVIPCENRVHHYWAQKPEYEPEIRTRIDRWRTMPLNKVYRELKEHALLLPPPLPKKKNLVRRIWENLTEGEPLRGRS